MKRTELYDSLIQSAAELTSREAPRWEFIAARIRYSQFEEELEERLAGLGISGFYGKLVYLTKEGLYGDYILEHYTEEEIPKAADRSGSAGFPGRRPVSRSRPARSPR